MTPGIASAYVVDCPTGLAGDMLLAACLDLGVPPELIHSPLRELGFENAYVLRVEEERNGACASEIIEQIEVPLRPLVNVLETIADVL